MGFLTLHVKLRHCYFSRDWSKLTSRAGTLSLRNKRLQNMTLITFKYLHFPDYPRYLKDMFYLHFSDYFLRGQNISVCQSLLLFLMVSTSSFTWQQNTGTLFPTITTLFQILILFVDWSWYPLIILMGSNEWILIFNSVWSKLSNLVG